MTSTPHFPNSFPPPLAYRDASPWQQHQAQFSACQVLEPAFPYLRRADWQQALGGVEPTLYVIADQVLLTNDGLAQLTHYLATCMPAAPPQPAAAEPAPTNRRKGRRGTLPPPQGQVAAALLEQLANVSYWRGLPLHQVTNEVLILGLRHYPDAQRPRPAEELF